MQNESEKSFPEVEFPHVITSSLRETFNGCHRKLYWSQVLGIVPVRKNVHLNFGAAYAKGLEHFRKSYYGQKYQKLPREERYENAIIDGFLAMVLEYGNYDPPEDETKNFDRLIGAYIEYLVQYPPETEHAKPSLFEGEPRVEFSFVFEIDDIRHPVTNNPLLFAGRFDHLADYTGGVFVFDDKTTGRLGTSWAAQWDLRSQFTAYTYGAQLAGHNVIGAIVRGMCILKTKFTTAEAIVYRPDWMTARWRERLTWDVKRMIDCWKNEYWPHTGEESGACSNYGGCSYKLLCSSANPMSYINTHYTPHRYDPLEREDGQLQDVLDKHGISLSVLRGE